jgi:hypothetical protein
LPFLSAGFIIQEAQKALNGEREMLWEVRAREMQQLLPVAQKCVRLTQSTVYHTRNSLEST